MKQFLLHTFVFAILFSFASGVVIAQSGPTNETIFTSGQQPPITSPNPDDFFQNQQVLVDPSPTFNQNQNVPPAPIPASNTGLSFNCGVVNKASIGGLFEYATCLMGRAIVPVLFSAALICFIWGVLRYVINAADSKERAEGRQFMIWGIVALFVMLSVWGLVNLLDNTFGLDNSMPTVPRFRE